MWLSTDRAIFAAVRGVRHGAPRLATAHLALLGAQVAFGLFPVLGTVAFGPGGLTPLAVGAWRLAAGATIIGALAAARHGTILPARSDLPRFVAAALLGVGVNQALFLVGLSRSTAVDTTLVMCLIPVFTFVIAALVGQERFSVARLAGVALALAGTLPLVFENGFRGLGRYGLGNVLIVTAALCYSAYLVISTPLARRYPALVVIAWAYTFSLPLAPYFAWGERLMPTAATAWWALGYIVVFPTVLAYLLNTFALARVTASTAAIYVYAQPLVAGLASWALFGETPSVTTLLGAAALFVGVWLVARGLSEPAMGVVGER